MRHTVHVRFAVSVSANEAAQKQGLRRRPTGLLMNMNIIALCKAIMNN